MPKTSPLLVWERSRLRTLALRLRDRMYELGLNETTLAARCQHLAPTGVAPSRERVAKILMNCSHAPKPSAAKVVMELEVHLLARALETSPEWLTGLGHNADPILWDALAHSHRAQEILHLLNHYEKRARETVVWAQSLMCSFTTPDFLHAYHEAFFQELDGLGLTERKRKLVEVYDRIGLARRERRLNGATSDKRFVQLILRSDLEKIARGTDAYRMISPQVRRRCLEYLHDFLTRAGNQIALVVAADEMVRDLVRALQDFDSVGVCDEGFVLLRTHTGDVVWSENKDYAGRYARLLGALRERARFRDRDSVLRLLDQLLVSLRSRAPHPGDPAASTRTQSSTRMWKGSAP